jgi:pyridoxal phosphate enzyme (YggS family)
MNIALNIRSVLDELPSKVTLVAISKTKPIEEIMEAYQTGHRIFGENKVQELTNKYEQMPKDIIWHMVGHLQSNKVKYIAPFVALIHSVDSLNLLKEIDKQAKKNNRIIDCLLEVHIAEEETKYGLGDDEVISIIGSPEIKTLENVRITGLMGMATYTDDNNQIRKEFRHLSTLFKTLKESHFANKPEFGEISMGMSSDYLIAIEEGSTLVRVGSKIFGNRNYSADI